MKENRPDDILVLAAMLITMLVMFTVVYFTGG